MLNDGILSIVGLPDGVAGGMVGCMPAGGATGTAIGGAGKTGGPGKAGAAGPGGP